MHSPPFDPAWLGLFTENQKTQIRRAAEAGRGKSVGISRDTAIRIGLEAAENQGIEIGFGQVRNVVNFLRGNPEASRKRSLRTEPSLEEAALAGEEGERRSYHEKGDVATVTLVTAKAVKTLDGLLAVCEMDGEAWEVLDWEASAWNSPVKESEYGESGKKTGEKAKIVQLHRVKARFKRKVFEPLLKELAADLLDDLKAAAPRILSPRNPAGSCLLAIHTPDLHHGKVPFDGDYDAPALHQEAIETLLARAAGFSLAEILFPIGNDALNTDGSRRSTTAGTMQDGLGRWQQEFREVVALYRRAIDAMLTVAPVRVVVVPGNHDEDAVFYLGEVLEAIYSASPDLTLDASLAPRKYYRFGTNLIGLTHGKDGKLKDLPMLMATEAPDDWARSTEREWLTGHLHQRQVEAQFGVSVRISPSLSPTDQWHKRKGYVGNPRAAEAVVYDVTEGRIAEFVYRVPGA